jgi:hypothetical protein
MKTKLLSFISNQIASYIEPERQGTARGEPIGLSSIKYRSTLLFLTNLKGKEIAEAVSVSYGLLRVWRTEDPYLTAIERHIRTFAGMVVKHIIEIMETTKTKGPDGKIVYFVVGTKINDQLAQDFADVALYSDHLMNDIYKQAKAQMFDDLSVFHTFLSYWGFLFALRKGYSLPLTAQAVFDSPVAEHQNGLIRFDFIEALQRPWTPDKEKAEQVKISFLKAL